ncbi:hypothetical protein M0804_000660 [Polistes exclamans]|nr:hypothetical protein M0804_000660 [Polistes exclamans]
MGMDERGIHGRNRDCYRNETLMSDENRKAAPLVIAILPGTPLLAKCDIFRNNCPYAKQPCRRYGNSGFTVSFLMSQIRRQRSAKD